MSDRIILLQTQENQITEYLVKMGLRLESFEWKINYAMGHDVKHDILEHINSSYYFDFGFNSRLRRFVISYAPGKQMRIEYGDSSVWLTILSVFVEWMKSLKREIEAPDLWTRYREEYEKSFQLDVGAAPSDAPFSHVQSERIIKAIQELKKEIRRSYNPNEVQWKFIEEKLDRMAEESKRMDIRQWVSNMAGNALAISISLALNAEEAKSLWYAFVNTVGNAADSISVVFQSVSKLIT